MWECKKGKEEGMAADRERREPREAMNELEGVVGTKEKPSQKKKKNRKAVRSNENSCPL